MMRRDSMGDLERFWSWVEGLAFQFKGEKFRVKVDRYNAIYPYPHAVVRRYAWHSSGAWGYDLDSCEPDSEVLMHLFRRFERQEGRK
jgi:hypothetical protein